MKKFFFSSVLALILIIVIGTISAYAEESGQCGENATWLLGNDGVLTISGTGEMDDYASTYSVPWYDYKDTIKECIIEDGITNIGSYSFNGFDKLERISIPDSVSRIGNHLFSFCTALTSIDIPDNVVSIGNSAFVSCTGLTDMIIPDKTTDIGYAAFYDCTGLESVTIPECIASIGDNAFSGCNKLKNVYIKNLAAWCNVSLGNSTSNPLFYGKNVYINNTLTTDLQIPEDVTSIQDYVFFSFTNLKSVVIPAGVSNIGVAAFSDCNKLLNVHYLGTRTEWNTVSMTNSSIDFARIHCIDDEELFSPESDFQFSDGTITKYTGNEHVVDIPPTIGEEPVKTIASGAFESTNVSIVTIPDSVTTVESRVFHGCNELRSVSLSSNTSSISSYMFSNCRNLTEITIPYGVTKISNYAFINCSNLESITIPDSVTSIGYSAFSSCANIKKVYYGGSEEAWKEININNTGNTTLTNANILYMVGEELRNLDYAITSLMLRDISTNNTLDKIPDTSFIVEINVENVSSEKTDVIIVAAYDKNESLLDMDFVYADLKIGESLTFGSLISNTNNTVHSVKAFIRPKLNSLIPLAESKEISK